MYMCRESEWDIALRRLIYVINRITEAGSLRDCVRLSRPSYRTVNIKDRSDKRSFILMRAHQDSNLELRFWRPSFYH
ncbi:MAG: hypothetical protein RL094_591 [Candidatus Parcubacteria bacterium]